MALMLKMAFSVFLALYLSFIFELLDEVNVTFETRSHLIDLCDKMSAHLSNEGKRLNRVVFPEI